MPRLPVGIVAEQFQAMSFRPPRVKECRGGLSYRTAELPLCAKQARHNVDNASLVLTGPSARWPNTSDALCNTTSSESLGCQDHSHPLGSLWVQPSMRPWPLAMSSSCKGDSRCESHIAAEAWLIYQMAFLKTHYRREFLVAVEHEQKKVRTI